MKTTISSFYTEVLKVNFYGFKEIFTYVLKNKTVVVWSYYGEAFIYDYLDNDINVLELLDNHTYELACYRNKLWC